VPPCASSAQFPILLATSMNGSSGGLLVSATYDDPFSKTTSFAT
jgi:hypothetical protein